MIRYILQRYCEDTETWEDTATSWNPDCYDNGNKFRKMLEDNLKYAKKVCPKVEFRIVKRNTIEEEVIL